MEYDLNVVVYCTVYLKFIICIVKKKEALLLTLGYRDVVFLLNCDCKTQKKYLFLSSCLFFAKRDDNVLNAVHF